MEKTGNQIIQDYGQTVNPDLYIRILQEHPYIPQSDQCMRNIVKRFHIENGSSIALDLGCGPARLTRTLKASKILGLDISESFIKHARLWESGIVNFGCIDFTKDFSEVETNNSGVKNFFPIKNKTFDIILMQGVMHHIHDNDREVFIKKCHKLLKDDGILIIGDEFIKDYGDNEDDRKYNACAFYLHIIAEAKKGGFNELAEEEAKNLIDDILAGTEFAGYGDTEVFEFIYTQARLFNDLFYSGNLPKIEPGFKSHLRNVNYVMNKVNEKSKLLKKENIENFNRGDLKVSMKHFINEIEHGGFVLKEKYGFGPVQELGGMGVLVFVKK